MEECGLNQNWQALPLRSFLMMFKADLTVKVNKILNDLEIVGYHKNICPTYFFKKWSDVLDTFPFYCLCLIHLIFVSFWSFWPIYSYECDHYLLSSLEKGWNIPKRRQLFWVSNSLATFETEDFSHKYIYFQVWWK